MTSILKFENAHLDETQGRKFTDLKPVFGHGSGVAGAVERMNPPRIPAVDHMTPLKNRLPDKISVPVKKSYMI